MKKVSTPNDLFFCIRCFTLYYCDKPGNLHLHFSDCITCDRKYFSSKFSADVDVFYIFSLKKWRKNENDNA